MVVPGTMFEELGFNYIGPIDGHDLDSLIPMLQNLRALKGPQFLHVVTHGDRVTSCRGRSGAVSRAGSSTQGGHRRQVGRQAHLYAGVRPVALRHGRPTRPWWASRRDARRFRHGQFANAHPSRYFDVGIAEQHALTFAGGLACEGPEAGGGDLFHLPAARLRSADHDIALQNLPFSSPSTAPAWSVPTARPAGSFDLTYLRCLPNVSVLAPADENECRQMLYTGFLRTIRWRCAIRAAPDRVWQCNRR